MMQLQMRRWDTFSEEAGMRILSGIGNGALWLLKGIGRVILFLLNMVLNVAKLILLLFSLILRIFMAFVRAGTP